MGVAEVASGTAAAGVAGAGLAAEVPSGEGAGLPVAGLQGGRECEHTICAMGGCRGNVIEEREPALLGQAGGTQGKHCLLEWEIQHGFTLSSSSPRTPCSQHFLEIKYQQ